MRIGHQIFSAVQLMIVAALFGLGGLLLGLHYAPHVREQVADWILQPDLSLLLLGYLVLGTALVLMICFALMQRTQYLRLRMRGREFFVEEAVVRQAIGQFWRIEFPSVAPPQEVFFARQRIEVITEAIECDLDELELRLSAFLAQKFGYDHEFFVTLTAK